MVLEAIELYRTGNDLHKKVITRTCSPNGGVCHNQSEYPDLRTPANFLATINAPCNVQPGDWTSVDDRCEQAGDRFMMADRDAPEVEIGHVEYIPGDIQDYREAGILPEVGSPGFHVFLREPLAIDREEIWGGGRFVRTFINDQGIIEDLPYATFTTRWWILDEGRHLVGEVRNYQIDRINELNAVGIVQGDLNRNGIYGARQERPVSLLTPGSPERSYLIGRMRGTMMGQPVAGSRMPLANQPLTIPEMLALFCFVEGLPADGAWPDMSAAIDYASCSYSDDPENLNLLGEGVTWKGRVSKVLQANCGGCHGGNNPAEDLDLRSEDAYEHLFNASVQRPGLKLIEPGNPEQSYLWLKLINDESIEGYPMPYNPLTGEGSLREGELGDIQTWITNGAIRDE
ncbi:hypothetical protein DL240_08115 [Lujinxingia litoralis]|uniref:Cytochrome C Planctomycete-type domain-containing protein n=2 Tax=Lujinxingia litoralis TaxID=2211119 RepID=A0A328C8H7_9DELT|nr:hypothetical protein DL240_08115 [Lujinxingia litoralis]